MIENDWLSYFNRKIVGLPTAAYTDAAVVSLSLIVHLLHSERLSILLYGKSIGSPLAMLELPHFFSRCFSTEEIFFRSRSVSSKYGLCPS